MPGWVKLDHGYFDHSKVLEAGPLASYFNLAAIAWSNRNLTDGKIPRRQLKRLVDWEGVAFLAGESDFTVDYEEPSACALAELLVEVGLWERDGSDFCIHDYHEFQRTASEITARRAYDRQRKKRPDAGFPTESERNPNGVHPDSALQEEEQEEEQENVNYTSRVDVDSLCDLLADRIAANLDGRRPRITSTWRTDMRRLLDLDKRTEAEVRAAIVYASRHEFWRANILSPSKLRKQFDRLTLERKPNGRPDTSAKTGTEQKINTWLTDHGFDIDANFIRATQLYLRGALTEENLR